MSNRPVKKRKMLSSARRWKKYAAAAVGAMAAGAATDRARAEIMYFNPDDVISSPLPDIHFDLDNSSGAAPGNINGLVQAFGFVPGPPAHMDFHFAEFDTSHSSLFLAAAGWNGDYGKIDKVHGAYLNIGFGYASYLTRFAFGEVISFGDESSNFGYGPWGNAYGFIERNGGGDWVGGTVTGYAGLRLDAGDGDFRFGWVQFTFDNAAYVLTLHDFAIETELNTPIPAGFTGSAIPEPSSLLLAALGSAGLLALRKRRKAT